MKVILFIAYVFILATEALSEDNGNLTYITHAHLYKNCYKFYHNFLAVDTQRHSGTITPATDKQRKDITVLIAKVEFGSVVENAPRNEYASHYGTTTKRTYRLDNEGGDKSFAYFRVQSDAVTYAQVSVQTKVEFGKKYIRNAFVQSLTKARPCRVTQQVNGKKKTNDITCQQ